MKYPYLTIFIIAILVKTSDAQTVYGALAIDRTNGYYFGWANDYANLSGAENRALKECKVKGGNCEVVLTWEGKGCAIYRTIPGNVGTAYGWGVAPTRAEADAIATKEALKRSNGVQPTNYVWACNSVGSFIELSNISAAEINKSSAIVKSILILKDEDGGEFEYEGELRDKQPHGSGKQKYVKDNSLYAGQFKNGKRSGVGTYLWKTGSSYTGGWLNDKFHGQGTYKWASGSIYTGEWKYGQMNGYGIWSTMSGTYEGEFKNGKEHGAGTLTAKPGQELANSPKAVKFVGTFINGNRSYGKLYNKTGELIYDGYFTKDKPNGTYPQ